MSIEGFNKEVFEEVFGKIDLKKYIDELNTEFISTFDCSILFSKARELEIEIHQNLITNDLRWPDSSENLREICRPEYFLLAFALLLSGWTSWVWNDKSINKVHKEEYRKQVSKILPYIKPSIDWAYEQGLINAKNKNP